MRLTITQLQVLTSTTPSAQTHKILTPLKHSPSLELITEKYKHIELPNRITEMIQKTLI